MSFLNKIDNSLCTQRKYLSYIFDERKECYLYGAGVYSTVVAKYLIKLGIVVKGFIVDESFWIPNQKILNKKVFKWNDVDVENKNIHVINSITSDPNKLYFQKFASRSIPFIDVPNYLDYGEDFLDKEWINQYEQDLMVIKNFLLDDLSKKTYIRFIERKIAILDNDDISFIEYGPSYFNSILPPQENEIFIDVGAFNGDTLKLYLEFNNNFGHIYLFEADGNNFSDLKIYLSELDESILNRISYYNLILSNSSGFLYLDTSQLDLSHKVCATSSIHYKKVNSSTLDSLISNNNNQPMRIKLDVNGHEYQVLVGSSKLISGTKPAIACKIQRKEDLIKIPSLLKSLRPDYNLIIRQKSLASLSLMLYAY